MRENGVTVASAGPYANHFHLALDRKSCQHLITQCLKADALPHAKLPKVVNVTEILFCCITLKS